MAILDQFRRLFKPDKTALEEGQTGNAKLAPLRREIAGHPSLGLTPEKLAAALGAAEEGDLLAQHELFLDMEEKDAHLFAEMSKRRRAVLSLPWRIVPPANATPAEKKAAEQMAEYLRELPDLEDVMLDLMDACGHGFSALEITWQRDGALWLPTNLEHRPQAWFQLDKANRTQLRLRDGSQDGAELLPFGWVLHTHRAKPGYIARAGLHRVLSWPYLFKALAVRDLAELLEIYGIPMRLGTYHSGASDAEKRALRAAVVGIGHRAAGIIPEGMAIDFKAAAEGSHQPFLEFATYMDRMVSKAILGGTLTSGTDGGGAYALGEVHNEVRRELLVSDARQIQGTLTRDLLYPIAALNGMAADPRRAPRFEFLTEEEKSVADLNSFTMGLARIVGLMGDDPKQGLPIGWLREQVGIPLPVDGEPVLTTPVVVEPGAPAAASALSPGPSPAGGVGAGALAAAAQPEPEGRTDDPVTLLAERMEEAAAPAQAALLDQVWALARKAESLEALRDQLLNAYGDLDSEELARVMTAGFAAAELVGMAEVAK